MVSFIYQFKKFFGSYEYFITLSWILAYVFVVKINSFQSVYNIFDRTLWRDDSSFDDGFVKYFYSRKWVLFWTKIWRIPVPRIYISDVNNSLGININSFDANVS